jgi:predicted ATPase
VIQHLRRVLEWRRDEMVQRGLAQLLDAELLYQQGLPPQATYRFKHALIQDAAYQSLLRSTRQQLHQRVAQALEAWFPETVEPQPELLAHHYTEAGLSGRAIPYWHRAGQRAVKRSANVEAIAHITRGLELLKTLPDTPEGTQQELDLQIILGPSLMATKGYAAPEVEHAYAQARELSEQIGETPQLFPMLAGLRRFYFVRGELQTARELGQQLAHPHSLTYALHHAALVHQFRREGQATQEQAEAEIALSRDQEFSLFAALGTILRGWALFDQGQEAEGLAQMRQGLDAWQTMGAELVRPYYLALLAEVYGRAGQAEEGLKMLAEAQTAMGKSGVRVYEADLLWREGELLLALSAEHHVEAAASFQQALEVARRQEAKSLELRAAMSLSRLWQRQGKRDEARALLAPIYGWFTEGFDTADLQEAKALLEELSR